VENLVGSEDAAANLADAADNTGETAVGEPTSFSATAMSDVDEDSAANATASTAAIDGAEDSVADLTVITTVADGAEASPAVIVDSTSDSINIPLEAGDDSEVNLTENAENENAASDGMIDGEIVFTPGTQRRADVSRFLSEGVSLAATGDHEAAIQKFDAALELDSEAPFLYKQRGASFHALGRYAAAVSDYDEAVQLNGEDVNAYYNRGAAHFALQDYAATVADYDEVIRLDPELANAYSKRADAHEALGNVGKAAQDRSVAAVFESNRDDPR
jgi:tetratricopeptide (TPR) repeat protein